MNSNTARDSMKLCVFVLALTLVICMSSCASKTTPSSTLSIEPTTILPTVAYNSPIHPTSPLSPPETIGYPLEPGRQFSALQSLDTALEQAKKWHSGALWVAIMPTTLVAANLGLPLGAEGWFFKFEPPDSPVEYFIHVGNKTITGASEAQPLIEPPYSFVPLDPSSLKIDSDMVMSIFLESDDRKDYINEYKHTAWDYRLVHLGGKPNPVWSLFDADNIRTPLINIDAITGEIVGDPFE